MSELVRAVKQIFVTVGYSRADYIVPVGSTTADVQIQEAIDAVNTAGGGIVFVKADTYSITTQIAPKSNVTVQCAGMGATVFNSSVGTNSWCFNPGTTGQDKDTLTNIWIKDCTIASITASHSAIIQNTTNCGFIRVEAYHTDWSAVRETLVTEHCENVGFYDNFIHDSSGNGVQVNACDYFHVRGNRVVNFYDNVAQSGANHMDDGIDIDEDFLDSHTVPSRYGTVEDNFIYGSTHGNNIRIASSQYVTVRNNKSLEHDCTAAASILVNSYSGINHPDTHDIFIDDNDIIGGSDSGIKLQDGGGGLIYGIFCRRNALNDVGNTAGAGQLSAGILLNVTGAVVTDNILDNCGKNNADAGATLVYKKNDQVIKRNHITNSPGAAVRFWNGSGSETYTGITLKDTQLSGNTSNYANLSIATGDIDRDQTIATTNATVTTLSTIPIPATTTTAITGYVTARRTGGAAGTAEDGALYRVEAVYKDVAGTPTSIGSAVTVIGESQAGWDVTLAVSGTNVLVQVTGAVNNNISWAGSLKTQQISA